VTTPGSVTPDRGDELVVIAALNALEWPTTVEECADGFEGEIYFGSYLASVQRVIAAVRPLIEAEARAQERQRIADAITAEAIGYLKRSRDAHSRNEWVLPGMANARVDGLRRAAHIARGETP
jgi:hypothetical protein